MISSTVSLADSIGGLVAAQDLLDHGVGLLHELVVRHHPGNHVRGQCPLGGDRLTGQQQLQRDPDTAGVDQTHDAAVGRMHSATYLEGAELRALRGDADVARHRQLDAVPDAPAVDRGDDGLGDARQRSPGDPAQAVLETFASDHRPDGLPLGRMGFQVGAGGERVAGSGDHGDAQRRVVAEVAPDVTQQFVGFDVDGVLDLWAVERDVGDLTALVVEHLCLS